MGEIGFQVKYDPPQVQPSVVTCQAQIRSLGLKMILGRIARLPVLVAGLMWGGVKFVLIYLISVIVTLVWGWVAFNLTVGVAALALYLLIKMVF